MLQVIGRFPGRLPGHLSKLIVVGLVLTSLVVFGQEGREKPYTPPKPEVARIPTRPVPTPDRTVRTDSDRFRGVRQPNNLFSWTSDHDHEDAGIETDGGGDYTGVFAIHSVYETGKVTLTPPPGATDTQTLFAPTTRPPNGACLEVGTSYTTEPAKSTTINLYVYDFCISPQAFVKNLPIDASFMAAYAGAEIEKAQAYAITIFTPDKSLSDNSTWYAELYNYKTKQWDLLYTGHGYYRLDVRGWSIFETWYRAGQCSESLPVLAASELSFYNYASSAWEPLALNMHHLSNYVHTGGMCFEDDPHSPATYKVEVLHPNNAWRVVSAVH